MMFWYFLESLRSTALPLYITLFLLLGLIFGSLMTVVVTRLPIALNSEKSEAWVLWYPASYCPHCHSTIKWHYNFPLIGWLILRGKCYVCRRPISKIYPMIECITGLIFAVLAWAFEFPEVTISLALLAWFLLALAIIDYQHFLLPDSLTLPLLWLGILWYAIWMPEQVIDMIFGSVTGYLLFRGVNAVFLALRGYDGLGRGDAKLLAALGAWLGWQSLPLVCLLAGITGIIGYIMWYGISNTNKQVPFGISLALSGWCIACWQAWYG